MEFSTRGRLTPFEIGETIPLDTKLIFDVDYSTFIELHKRSVENCLCRYVTGRGLKIMRITR